MSERIVLVCEWCEKTPVVRYRLSRGAKIKDDVLLDFCAGDNRKFIKLILPRQRQKAGVNHAGPTRDKQGTSAEIAARLEKLMQKGEEYAPKQLADKLHPKICHVRHALKILMASKKVTRKGHRRSTRYMKGG